MSQLEVSKAEAGEERSEQTRSFVRTVKAAARRKYTPEEKTRIVLEGFRREVTVNDLCRREGIKPHSYYSWTKEFMEAGKERLTRDSVRDATQHEVGQLKRENGELKELVADLSLEAYRLKKTAIPMPQDAAEIALNGRVMNSVRHGGPWWTRTTDIHLLRTKLYPFGLSPLLHNRWSVDLNGSETSSTIIPTGSVYTTINSIVCNKLRLGSLMTPAN